MLYNMMLQKYREYGLLDESRIRFCLKEQRVPLLYFINPCEWIIIFLSSPVIADFIPDRSATQESIYANHTVKMSVILPGLLNAYFYIGIRL